MAPLEMPEVRTALDAANVALSGRRRREASSFASVELRKTDAERHPGRWEILAATALGCLAVVAVVVLWFS